MRKVLSFVLVLSLVLGSFSMAFAATPAGLSDIDGISNEEAIQVNFDLGIVTGNPDGSFQPTKAVNRAEFAAMITRALAIPSSALAGYTATTFKDTTGYGWAVPYLAFCQSKGIMIGDGNGNVMPGRTINTNEAMTMVLRAIGYTANSDVLVGAWPANYVSLAQDKDLYDSVAAVVSVDKANAAQIIYNALTLDKVAVNSDGTTTPLVGTSLLTAGLNCTAPAKGVIGDDYTNDAVINVQPYMGMYGQVYLNSDSEIVAFISDSTSMEGEWTVASSNFEFDDDDYSFASGVSTSAVQPLFENGEKTGTVSIGALANATTYTLNVDLSGKTMKDLYSVSTWDATTGTTAKVDAADLEAIDDEELLGYEFKLTEDDDIDFDSFALVGAASLDKIAKDNIVYVYAGGNSGDITKIAVGTEVVTGKVTKVSGSDYTVNGKAYSFSTYASADRPVAGDEVEMNLDAYGDVYEFDIVSSTPDTYGVVIGYNFATNNIDDTKVKLFTSEDKTTTFTVVGNSDISITTGDAITTTALNAGSLTAAELVGYGLDKDGSIETFDGTAVTDAAFNLVSAKVLSIGGTTYPVNNDVVVFAYDSVGDDYSVVNIDKVDTGALSQLNVSVSAILDSGKVVALLIDEDDADKTSDDVYAVINGFDSVYDAELDDNVFNLVGFAGGAAIDKNTDSDAVAFTTATAGFDTTVALYNIVYDGDGYIKTITASAGAVGYANMTIAAISNDKHTVQLGTTTAGVWAEIADTAAVYEVTDLGVAADQAYKVSSINSLRASSPAVTYTIWLFDTDDDTDGADVVIFTK